MNAVLIVQARMTSTRLPGKVLKTVLGKSLLEYQIERLKRVSNVCDIVIATTDKVTDDPIVDLCKRLNVSVFRGSEDDVLSRYYHAAKAHDADLVVRVTSDCPLIDPAVIDEVIETIVKKYPKVDYVSNCLQRTFPRGMDTEVFTMDALRFAFEYARVPAEREHVTPYIYNNQKQFACENVTYDSNESRHRWTVDTLEDLDLIKVILESLYPVNKEFTLRDILNFMNKNPKLFSINAHVEQKHV